MPPLYEQRATLIAENVTLILQWLTLLPPEHQRYLIESMVRRYTLAELRAMRAHVAGEVATQLARQVDGA